MGPDKKTTPKTDKPAETPKVTPKVTLKATPKITTKEKAYAIYEAKGTHIITFTRKVHGEEYEKAAKHFVHVHKSKGYFIK